MNPGISDTEAVMGAANRVSSYRVEVSGWDAKENFFVEKTSLDWREREGKTVALHAAVRLDCVLVVRLLGAPGGGAGASSRQRRFMQRGETGAVTTAPGSVGEYGGRD